MTEQIFWLAMFGISAFTLGYLVADLRALLRRQKLVEQLLDDFAAGDWPLVPAECRSEHGEVR